MWWDGPNSNYIDSAFLKTVADSIRTLQPRCVVWSDQKGKSGMADARWIGNAEGKSGNPCWATEDAAFSDLNSGVAGGAIYCPAEVSSSIRPGWFWHESENDKVNSVEALWNKYLQSAGRNAVWTLSIPPDTRGLIYENDSMRIDSVNCLISGTFRTNLAAGATVTVNHPRGAGYGPYNLFDTAEATYFATPDDIFTDTIVVDLGSAKTFDVLMLREVIELGHRTTGWSVDYAPDTTSYTSLLADKQSVGYRWLEQFDPVTARYVRLRITKGQACVALNTFGVYKKQYSPPEVAARKVRSAAHRTAARSFVTIPVFGRLLDVPSSFAGKPFTAELLDLSGRVIAVTTVDAIPTLTRNGVRESVARSGLLLVRCTSESGVVVGKFMVR
jgi:alpha-L-fucosidase